MALTVDLEGPLAEFYARTAELRRVVSAVEALARNPQGLHTNRRGIDLSLTSLATGNTANAMSLVFLASSFEEFIREEISQSGEYLSQCYARLPEEFKNLTRNHYWILCVDKLKYIRGLLTSTKPRGIDPTMLASARAVVETTRGFPIMDDSTAIDGTLFAIHSRNFRPKVVIEIGNRIGIKNLISDASENAKLKNYFGVAKKTEVEPRLTSKLDTFYKTRNEIVHSLNGARGYGADVVLDYLELFEGTADGVKIAIEKHLSRW